MRNKLIEQYFSVVEYQAERIHRRLPSSVDVDDLKSAGVFGLVDAINNFDLDHNVKFRTYCSQRIRGAILDALRRDDWVPRLVRSKANKLNAARAELETKLGQAPKDEDLAQFLKLSMSEYRAMVRAGSPTQIVSLSDKLGEDESGRSLTTVDLISSQREPNPVHKLQTHDFLKSVACRLSRKERVILMLYYFEGMTMREVGYTLNLSESRVCQLHSQMLTLLKRDFQFEDFADFRCA